MTSIEQSNNSAPPPSSTPKKRAGRKPGDPHNKGRTKGIKSKPPTPTTEARDQLFFDTVVSGKSVSFAAKEAGYLLRTLYARKDNDEAFATRWADALEGRLHTYEDEVHRRAVSGTAKPVFYKGEQCGAIQEYSDTLLLAALRAMAPEKYRENVNFSGSVNHKLTHEFVLRSANQRALENIAKLRADPKVIDHE